MNKYTYYLIATMMLAFFVPPSPSEELYWPGKKWEVIRPELQGMDPNYLFQAVNKMATVNINSLTVIRNGKIVCDVYVYPFKKGDGHVIHSCTKSIMSALIGIAIGEGHIENTGVTLEQIFGKKAFKRRNKKNRKITLESLLTMTSGMETKDNYNYGWFGINQIRNCNCDWVQYILNLKMIYKPGEHFEYSNLTSFMLSAIIREKTGVNTINFAEEKLFKPLGFEKYSWPVNPQGITIGWGDLVITPHDMAKFGLLYLRNGKWKDQQLIAKEWVKESVKAKVEADLMEGYGYQWWVEEGDYFAALGYAGQFIFVLPKYDMLVVFTSGLAQSQFFIPRDILTDYIIKSVQSEKSITQNDSAYNLLVNRGNLLAAAPPVTIPKIPDIAKKISGKKYVMDKNPIADWFVLDVNGDSSLAVCTMNSPSYGKLTINIGLDNNYRSTIYDNKRHTVTLYAMGGWITDNELQIELKTMEDPDNIISTLAFTGNEVLLNYQSLMTGMLFIQIKGRAVD